MENQIIMKTDNNKEDLFRFINKKDGSQIDENIKKCWYEARAYVLHNLPEWESKIKIGKDSPHHLCFIIHCFCIDDEPLMFSVVRQLALSAHYINFDEVNGRNATEIIILCNDMERVADILKGEEYLSNLYEYSERSYIDIKIKLRKSYQNSDAIIIKADEVKEFIAGRESDDVYNIDTTKSQYVNMVYNVGMPIDNLPSSDMYTAERYNLAINVFCRQTHEQVKEKWNSLLKDINSTRFFQFQIRKIISNVFCSDCFESLIRGCGGNGNRTNPAEYIAQNLDIFTRREHSRWVVERLILGYTSPSSEDIYSLEETFGLERKNKIEKMKAEYKHIDLCSYWDLRRIDPDNIKYDSFLMLAAPYILGNQNLD